MTHLDLLYRSFDQTLSHDEEKTLRDALAASPELGLEKARIEEMRALVSQNRRSAFKPFFTARVIQRIDALENPAVNFLAHLFSSFRLVTLTGAAAVALLIAINVASATAADQNDSIGWSESKELVHNALKKLDPNFRSVAVLRLIDGYSTKETAEILGVPLGTVLSRLSRAQKKLKNLLAPYIEEKV